MYRRRAAVLTSTWSGLSEQRSIRVLSWFQSEHFSIQPGIGRWLGVVMSLNDLSRDFSQMNSEPMRIVSIPGPDAPGGASGVRRHVGGGARGKIMPRSTRITRLLPMRFPWEKSGKAVER